jgi:hypothetical protein
VSRQRALQAPTPPAEQSHRRSHRAYTVAQLLSVELLNMSARTFTRLKGRGELPFLEELHPRLGRVIRYRADLVDRYLAGAWGAVRAFKGARRLSHAVQSATSRARHEVNSLAGARQ